MSITQILNELNESNSSLHKIAIFNKHKDNSLLQRVLQMANDTVLYTYGVTVPQIEKFKPTLVTNMTLENALSVLELDFCTRNYTGHEALQMASNILASLNPEDADVIRKVINRDLRINIGKTQINKVWKDLITKPIYMRCDVYSKKTSKNINFPAIVQLKADGTYREFTVDSNRVSARSRSGEPYEYPIIFETLSAYPDGVYTGELTVKGIADRAKGNGLINSDEPPHEDIVLDLWDFIVLAEYNNAGKKDKKSPNVTQYETRFELLTTIVKANEGKNVQVIPTTIVNSLKEALEITSKYMTDGFEGAILKDLSGLFKDGTSKHQLKLKLQIDCEMRITGFTEGSGKNADYFGAITFENDEGTIKGKVGVSSMTEALRDWFHDHRASVIAKVMTVQFNDLSKADGNDYHALSHPRFIELRNDKDTTDTLETVLKLRDMAMELS